MIALHTTEVAVTESTRSGVCVVHVPRCFEKTMFDTGVVKLDLFLASSRHRSDYAAVAPG